MNPLLLLHNRYDYNTSDIWRAAIKRGWKTERIHDFNVKEKIGENEYIRYYGNTIQAKNIENIIPFKFLLIPPQILFDKLTFRRVDLLTYSELKQPIDKDIFIKPVDDKWFEARIYKIGETISGSPLNGDLIYTSEIVELLDEVRCFCLNGEILTSSYYKRNTLVEMDNFDSKLGGTPLREYVKLLYENYDLPDGIVLDFGLTKDQKWIFIEANQAWASGIYWCDPDKCLDVIINSQKDL